jgi:hypothetical protein
LRDHFTASMNESRDGRILVEEFIDGTKVTVEGFSVAGKCCVLAISEKAHYDFNPCVARRLAYPPRFDQEITARIVEVAENVVNSLGLQDGISQGEYRLREGIPHLATRHGKDISSRLVIRATKWTRNHGV